MQSLKIERFACLLLPAALLVFGNCGERSDPQLADGCSYEYSSGQTELKWTAYKFTDRAGVSGGFSSYQVEGMAKAGTVREALSGLTFEIDANSVDTGLADRDGKIQRRFFGTMQSPGIITGSVTSVGDNVGTLTLNFNGQSKTLPVEYSLQNDVELSVKAILDLGDWQAKSSLASLQKVCEAQHTGADLKSILWPDVMIEIRTVLDRDCAAAAR